MKILKTSLFILLIQPMLAQNKTEPHKGDLVKWMSFTEAAKKAKKAKKPIIVDVYTTWCGPCKMMSANTFNNPKIAEYINKNYYPVKFDAETRDTVYLESFVNDTTFDKTGKQIVKQKPYTFKFYNQYPETQKRPPHQFAISLLDGELSYPSIVFLNGDVQRLNIIKGYHDIKQFEPIMKFFGGNVYLKQSWEEFNKSFVSEFQ
jgi:thioredoxin-related protein